MPKTESKSAAENEQTQAPQYAQHPPPYPQQFEDDTIDLYEPVSYTHLTLPTKA